MRARARVRVRVRETACVCACWCPLWCPFREWRCTESQHTGLSQLVFPKGEAPSAGPLTRRTTTTPSPVRIESGSRALALFLLNTTSLRPTTGCVSPDRLASRPEPFGSALLSLITSDQASTHSFRANAPLRREVSKLCAQHGYHCALTLNWRAATVPQRQATGCVSPDRLVSRSETSSLCCTKPDHFGPNEHTRRPRHPRMSALATGSYDTSRLISAQQGVLATSPFTHLGATTCIAHLGMIGESLFSDSIQIQGSRKDKETKAETPRTRKRTQTRQTANQALLNARDFTLSRLYPQTWPRPHLSTFKNEGSPLHTRQTGRCRR